MIKIISVSRTRAQALGCVLSGLILSGCTTMDNLGKALMRTGAFLSPAEGPLFKPAADWNPRKESLLYIYRPKDEWADAELVAPSLFANDEQQGKLVSGGYLWYRLEPGYQLVAMKRPILGLEIDDIAELSFYATAGQVRVIRYSEIEPQLEGLAEVDGPMQMLSTPVAENTELRNSRLLQEGGALLLAHNPQDLYARAEQQFDGIEYNPEPVEETQGFSWWPF